MLIIPGRLTANADAAGVKATLPNLVRKVDFISLTSSCQGCAEDTVYLSRTWAGSARSDFSTTKTRVIKEQRLERMSTHVLFHFALKMLGKTTDLVCSVHVVKHARVTVGGQRGPVQSVVQCCSSTTERQHFLSTKPQSPDSSLTERLL